MMVLAIDGSNSISSGAIAYLSNLLKYAEPEKYGIYKVILFGSRRLLSQIENKSWLAKIYEPELDRGITHRLRWLWFKFPKLVDGADLIFFAGANYTKVKSVSLSVCHNILPFMNFEQYYSLSKQRFINGYRRWSQRRAFETSKGVIFLTEYAKEIVLKKLNRIPPYLKVIPHGIESRFYIEPRRQKKIDDYSFQKPFNFLYISQIRLYKHQWSVIRAFRILRKKGYPISVTFIGPITNKRAFRLFMKSIKDCDPHGEFTNYLGAVPYISIHEYYKTYDAYVFASTCENLPFTLMEPMAAGLPIASSDFGLTREILGNDSVYFDSQRPETIAEAIAKLIDDKDFRERIAWNNYEKAKRYTWERCADITFKFMRLVY